MKQRLHYTVHIPSLPSIPCTVHAPRITQQTLLINDCQMAMNAQMQLDENLRRSKANVEQTRIKILIRMDNLLHTFGLNNSILQKLK